MTDSVQPPFYQIRVKGHLSRKWEDWFAGLVITLEENGDTLLTGAVVDQAAEEAAAGELVQRRQWPARQRFAVESGVEVERRCAAPQQPCIQPGRRRWG